jgi:D-arabinose 1-dehydrogenase-like Zn-dependent alcohol dehydrogenase
MDLGTQVKCFTEGKVKPMIEVFSLDQIGDACKKVEEGKVRFRAVISMSK